MRTLAAQHFRSQQQLRLATCFFARQCTLHAAYVLRSAQGLAYICGSGKPAQHDISSCVGKTYINNDTSAWSNTTFHSAQSLVLWSPFPTVLSFKAKQQHDNFKVNIIYTAIR